MSISAIEIEIPLAQHVTVTNGTLCVDLSDGRNISVPLAWFPRLQHASPLERKHWRLIRKGTGIHWEDIDEDISVEGLLAGRPSGESQRSFKRLVSGPIIPPPQAFKRTQEKHAQVNREAEFVLCVRNEGCDACWFFAWAKSRSQA